MLIAKLTKFVITEWDLLIDYGLLIIDDGDADDEANDANNDENTRDVGDEEYS